VFFLTCIFCYVWRTGSVLDSSDLPQLSPHAALGVRISITGVFVLGLVYLVMIIKTLSRYGSAMDEAWTKRASEWQQGKLYHAHTGMKHSNVPYTTSSDSSYVRINPVTTAHQRPRFSESREPEVPPSATEPVLVEDYETSSAPTTEDAASENLRWTSRPASV
jgi:hypothetical protein